MAERSGTPAAAGPARESALGDALVVQDNQMKVAVLKGSKLQKYKIAT